MDPNAPTDSAPAAVTVNVPGMRAWLASSSDVSSTPGDHQAWVDFLRIDTGVSAGDLGGVTATLAVFADMVGVLTSTDAVEGVRVVETRDGDVRAEVALATGVVLSTDDIDLIGAVGYLTGADAATAVLEAVVAAANEAVALYRVAPVEV